MMNQNIVAGKGQKPMTKVAITARCRAILETTRGRVKADDDIWLRTEVFPRHPDWEEKSGPGVSHIEVRISGVYASKCFWLIRMDGSEVDISYRTSINGRGTPYAQIVGAARNEILPQISNWKASNVAPMPDMHCDHVRPFDWIFKEWMNAVDLQAEEIRITRQLVGHTDLFLSRELAISWQRFHNKHATYQWLTAKENNQKSNKMPAQKDTWLADYDAEMARVA